MDYPYITISIALHFASPLFFQTEIPLPFPQNHPLWAKDSLDVGYISCIPYKARLKQGVSPVYHKQYHLFKWKEEGIRPIIEQFPKQGILRPIISPYNTPINPVKKSDGSYIQLCAGSPSHK